MSDILRTEGQIAGEKAKVDPDALKAAREQLADAGKPYTEEDVRKQAYINAMKPWGTGSTMQQAVQAATAAIQGLAGGNIGQVISGAAAPYLAEVIHEKTTSDQAAKAMAHTVVGAVTSWAAGNSAAAGAAGALTGEVMAKLVMAQLYPGKAVSDLTETEKQTISALGTLAAGLAGGITGDSTADAVAGAQAGKNSSENNSLALVARGCAALSPCRSKVAEQLLEIGAKAGMAGLAGAGGAALKEVADKMTADELDHLATLALMGNDELTGKYLSSLQDKYSPSHTGGDQIVETGPTNTGGNQITDTGPTNTGNNQLPEQGATNTGNTEGVPDTGGNTTITPIPDGPNKDDLAYLAEGGKNTPETQASIDNKLTNYLLEKDHPVGGSKAEWFDKALGFNKDNSSELAKQIVFEPSKAVETAETQHGVKYDQVISITGANGRVIDVKFGWIKNNDGIVRLVTAIPAKK